MAKRVLFDEAYYDRFYRRRRTRARTSRDVAQLGAFACAYLRYMKLPVRRVLDIGCGLGFWEDVIAEYYPSARYTGVEHSEYLCATHGWQRGSVVDYRARAPFDLVICQDVVQYLGHRDAAAAIRNLAALCRGALYFFVLTKEDWEENCDRERTDADVYLRTARWYRRHLGNAFVNAGGGMFLHRDSPVVMFELEAPFQGSMNPLPRGKR